MKFVIGVVLAILVIGGGAVWYHHRTAAPMFSFRTATIKRGDLVATIGASGTVEPEEVIDVGAQVAGQINSFGPDPRVPNKTVDYGSEVDEGTILAEIDRTIYAADTASALAQLAQARANLQSAQANIAQLDAKVAQTQADWNRYQQLGTPVVAQTDYDAARANFLSAAAQRKIGDAAIAQAQAAINVAEAAYAKAKRSEEYCTIKSPVKGVIIDRRVNIGQTVVSSLNTPSLFLIAKDLKRMQVWASANEADVGTIKPGQQANFTVDAFPGRTFHGSVNKVRLNATMTQNVVTYTVEISTDNSDGTLLPYLTANVQFETDRHRGVLLPNPALRWVPQAQQIEPEFREQYSGDNAINAAGHGASKHVWIVQPDGLVRPLDVTAGLSDGSTTEIEGSAIKDGEEIVTGEEHTSGESAANPFMPNFGAKKK